ncbi:hypothetical protein BACDOR_02165 [Phocaeicola dorei DSM 17855]|uniref:Uncharacterized protein n=1 Tax=Phocaeicola dorei DSM 17855 TaxID=483217 RepID=B6VY05_9BACT|nr:hypothetical protein BACDOR_02165 [Phocaeicola dorei DSM 17855]
MILQKKNKKKLSKNDKNISFIILYKTKMNEETFFMREERGWKGRLHISGRKPFIYFFQKSKCTCFFPSY